MKSLIENPSTPLSQTHINTLQNQKIDLQNHYRPTELEINTVGSYLWGCSQNYYGDVNKSCSPLCINSLYSEDNDCQYSIWTYSGELNNILNTKTTQAYIYVENNWTGFTNTDIEKLKLNSISHATILKTQNSQHKIVLPMTSISNLPIIRNYFEHEYEVKESYNYYWILILIVLAIVLFLNFK